MVVDEVVFIAAVAHTGAGADQVLPRAAHAPNASHEHARDLHLVLVISATALARAAQVALEPSLFGPLAPPLLFVVVEALTPVARYQLGDPLLQGMLLLKLPVFDVLLNPCFKLSFLLGNGEWRRAESGVATVGHSGHWLRLENQGMLGRLHALGGLDHRTVRHRTFHMRRQWAHGR